MVAAAVQADPLPRHPAIWTTRFRSDQRGARHCSPLGAADTVAALQLYNEFTFGPPVTEAGLFHAVLAHPGTTVFGVVAADRLFSMVTLHVLPNVTWGGRPYALVENVVTTETARGQGFGRAVIEAAIAEAWANDCYKIMLLTGQKRGAKGFYEAVGFSQEDKFGMVIRRR